MLLQFSDYDDCVGVTCQNGGTCVDGVNSYTCNCVAGYTGSDCSSGTVTFDLYFLSYLFLNLNLLFKNASNTL